MNDKKTGHDDGMDITRLGDETEEALGDYDCERLAAIVVKATSLAARFLGRCEGQAEAILHLKAQVATLEARERGRMLQTPWNTEETRT